jgi:hypothetical protein
MSVITAGYGASLADVTGGALFATTARESRTLSLDVGQVHELDRHGDDITSIGVGTPLVRDRLFLRVAAELQLEHWDGVEDAEGILPTTPDPTQRTGRGAIKLIWLPRSEQRLELLAAGDFSRQDHIPDLRVLADAQPRFEANDVALSGAWHGRLGHRLTGRVQLFGERNQLRRSPWAAWGRRSVRTFRSSIIFPGRRCRATGPGVLIPSSGPWSSWPESRRPCPRRPGCVPRHA